MKTKVTEQGVTIPKEWFDNIDEVEIRRVDNRIVVIPLTDQDPIMQLGQNPVDGGEPDASENLDHYLYGSSD